MKFYTEKTKAVAWCHCCTIGESGIRLICNNNHIIGLEEILISAMVIGDLEVTMPAIWT